MRKQTDDKSACKILVTAMLTRKQLHKRTVTHKFIEEKEEEVGMQVQTNISAALDDNECAGNSILKFVASVFHKHPRDSVTYGQGASVLSVKHGKEEDQSSDSIATLAHGSPSSSPADAMSIDDSNEGHYPKRGLEECGSFNSLLSSSITSSCSPSGDSDDSGTDVVSEDEDHGEVRVTVLEEDINEFCRSSEFSQHQKDVKSSIDAKGNKVGKLRSALSMADLRSAYQEQEKKKRHMRFSSTVHVCLVPTRTEMNNIFDDLYFRPEDFSTFKREAVAELREVLTRLGITSKQAIKLMYQPEADTDLAESSSSSVQDYTVGPSLSDDSGDEKEDNKRRESNANTISTSTSISTSIDGEGNCGNGENMASQHIETVDVAPNVQNVPRAKLATKGARRDPDFKVRFVIKEAETPADINPNIASAKANVISVMESMDYLASYDEGPSLSDDEEESKKYEDRISRTIKASTPFLAGVKTDVELNSAKETHSSKNARINLPSKTPNGGGVGCSDMWEVAWRKKP